jgi:hypothetical protein
MKNITITEIKGEDVHFDQDIDTDTVIASGGGVAVNGDMKDSAVNTGFNSGIIAGDDVSLDDSIVGDGNLQVNDTHADAFAFGGDATSASGENVNLGSGQIFDVDAGEDATIVTGHGNEVTGDVDVDVDHADGPVNVAVGDDNSQYGFEDESSTIEGSFNLDASVEDSGNTMTQESTSMSYEDNDSHSESVEGSFNTSVEDNDISTWSESASWTDDSSYEDNDSWVAETEMELEQIAVWGDDNMVEAE